MPRLELDPDLCLFVSSINPSPVHHPLFLVLIGSSWILPLLVELDFPTLLCELLTGSRVGRI